MKEQDSIPTSKVQRASKFLQTGAKVGRNYIKHYARNVVKPGSGREQLDKDNAEDIYASLSELKGSALKVAQMMSMDQTVLPTAFIDKFTQAQYNAPPLSYPLVVKTFRKYFQKDPTEIFDTFTQSAVNAASMGQVHKATLNGRELAVKIQYPGVAESVHSDLNMVKPLASRLFNINLKEMEQYVEEIEERLLEETDYILELERSRRISAACSHLEDLVFSKYYPEMSCERIIVMDWIHGMHLDKFLLTEPSQELRNRIGQALWDFYEFQVHNLGELHADPHPGNFLITPEGKVAVLDFGCVKVIPEEFRRPFFELLQSDILDREDELLTIFRKLDFILESDTQKEKDIFIPIFKEMIELLGRPFHHDTFDFGDANYFKTIAETGERIGRMKEVRQSKSPRGSRHGIYLNRAYFGLYNTLHQLKANIRTRPKF
ncbi:MAG: phosphotransferase [Bacteroidia bacterium]|nr:phosphotransferase [Bacteroidia bacterium]